MNLPHFIVSKEKTKITGTFVHCFIGFERRVQKEYINLASPPPLNPYDSTVQAAAYTIAWIWSEHFTFQSTRPSALASRQLLRLLSMAQNVARPCAHMSAHISAHTSAHVTHVTCGAAARSSECSYECSHESSCDSCNMLRGSPLIWALIWVLTRVLMWLTAYMLLWASSSPFFGEGRNMTNGQTHISRWVKNVTNGQTHIGGWVENVTNGRTDEHT